MAPAGWLGVIVVRGAGVKDLVVVQELDVAGAKIHVQADGVAGSQRVDHIHGFDLDGRQTARPPVLPGRLG